MDRRVPAAAAWLLGGGVYVTAALAWNGYDGFPDVALLPVSGAVVSAAFVGLSLGVGTAFCSTRFARLWRSSSVWAAAVAIGSAALLALGSAAGITSEYTRPDTGERFQALHPAAAIGGYALLLFAVVHWPQGRASEAEPPPAPGRAGP